MQRTNSLGVPWLMPALVVLAIALVAATYLVVLPALHVSPDPVIALIVATAAAVVVLGVNVLALGRSGDDSMQATLTAIATWLPAAIAASLIVLMLFDQPPPIAVGGGLLVSILLWLAAGYLLRASARVDAAQPRSYAELVDRVEALLADADVFGSDERMSRLQGDLHDIAATALREFRDHVRSVAAELGIPNGAPRSGAGYVTGSAYIDLWNRVHRAEEAEIMLAPLPVVLSGAAHDRLRLEDSNMENDDKLIALLDTAVTALTQAQITASDEARARSDLRVVRNSIDRYRDDIWDKMIRAKAQLFRTMLLTGITAVAALVLGVLAGADRTVVVGASAFYLVGAVVGLFARLRSESESSGAVDDYGLADARLQVTPLISGLAGIFGAALMAKVILPTTDVIAPASVDESGKVTTVASEVRTPPALHDVFDVDLNPGGFLLAAIFGLTPGLVLDRLKDQADKYKADLQASGLTETKKDQ